MSYSVLGKDDENLRVTVTEGSEQTVISIQPAALTIIGAVTSVNGQTGAVTVNEGLTEAQVDARVQVGIDGLIDGAPGTLDTLNELAAALNDDEAAYDTLNNLITTNSNNIALKLNTSDFTSTANTWLATKNTGELSEGTNLYYTDARVNTFLTDGSVSSINFGGNTTLSWNADDGTLEFPVNNDVTLQIGQEQLIHVKNESGVSLTNGQVVYVTGASGSKLTVDIADKSTEGTSAATIAVMTQDLGNNSVGYATTNGLVRGLNTSAYAEGAAIYLNANGGWSTTKPLTPDHLVPVGWIVRSHATEGTIFVHINNGQEMEELHDVLITNVQDGQGIVWNATGGYWENQTISVDLSSYATISYVDSQAHFSGDYNSLTNKPTLFDGDYNSLTNTPTLFDGDYNSLTNKPTLFDGDYNSLTNTPDLYDLTLPSQEFWTLTSDFSAAGQDLSATVKNIPVNLGALGAFFPAVSDMYMAFSIGTNAGKNVMRAVAKGTADDGTHDGIAIIHGGNNAIYSWAESGFSFNPLEIKADETTLSMDYVGSLNDVLKVKTIGTPSNGDESRVRIGFQDGATFKEGGTIATMYDNAGNWEFKFQGIDPENNNVFNNLTIRENYIYSDNPFKMTNYTTTDLGNISNPQSGSLAWDITSSSLKVYDGSAWSAVGGGGGASALGDLTDVTLTSVADGDLIRYNGTAGEWQNTNLGLSLTPTFNLSDGAIFTNMIESHVTITNWANYDDPHVFAEVYDNLGTLTIGNDDITVDANGVITFIGPDADTDYELRVKVQDFGDLASDTATLLFDTVAYGGTFRYWRFTDWSGGTPGHTLVSEIELWSQSSQTGSNYPAQMTSNTTPTPYVISTDYNYPGYEAWEAFDDSLNNQWWNLGRTGGYTDSYLQVDLGSSIEIKSIKIWIAGFAADSVKLYGSNTGSFTGEETLIDTIPLQLNSTINRG